MSIYIFKNCIIFCTSCNLSFTSINTSIHFSYRPFYFNTKQIFCRFKNRTIFCRTMNIKPLKVSTIDDAIYISTFHSVVICYPIPII